MPDEPGADDVILGCKIHNRNGYLSCLDSGDSVDPYGHLVLDLASAGVVSGRWYYLSLDSVSIYHRVRLFSNAW